MQKSMIAKYPGRCALTGAPIRPGDSITYDTVAKRAFFSEPGDCQVDSSCLMESENDTDYLAARTRTPKEYRSHVFNFSGKEYYQNKQGRCEDAPCCGCCTI
jgi:hypothetical protein